MGKGWALIPSGMQKESEKNSRKRLWVEQARFRRNKGLADGDHEERGFALRSAGMRTKCGLELALTKGFIPSPRTMREAPGREGFDWSGRWDLNPRQLAWEARTLPLSYARPLQKRKRILRRSRC